jgi:hypothetical protein
MIRSIPFLGRLVVVSACGALLLAGCGDDSSPEDAPPGQDAGADGGSDSGAAAPGDSDPAPGRVSTGGSGTFSVDGKTWDVDVIFCAFDPEVSGNQDVQFSFRALGVEAGRAFTLDGAVIGDELRSPAGGNLDMWFNDDTTTVVYAPAFSAGGPGGPGWQLEGSNVRFEDEYQDADGENVGPGIFEGTCP